MCVVQTNRITFYQIAIEIVSKNSYLASVESNCTINESIKGAASLRRYGITFDGNIDVLYISKICQFKMGPETDSNRSPQFRQSCKDRREKLWKHSRYIRHVLMYLAIACWLNSLWYPTCALLQIKTPKIILKPHPS